MQISSQFAIEDAYFAYSVAFWFHSLNIGFVNSCCCQEGLQILLLFAAGQCLSSTFYYTLGPQLEHRVCKFESLQAGLADLVGIRYRTCVFNVFCCVLGPQLEHRVCIFP